MVALRKAYGVLLLLFALFTGASIAAPLLKLPPEYVGGLGLDVGTFLFKNAGVFSFCIPLVLLIAALGVLVGRVFRAVIFSLYVVLLFFVVELALSLWFGGVFAGRLAAFLRNTLVKGIGVFGSNLLLVGLLLLLLIALEVDVKLFSLFRPLFASKAPRRKQEETEPAAEPQRTFEEAAERSEPPKVELSELKPEPKKEVPSLRTLRGEDFAPSGTSSERERPGDKRAKEEPAADKGGDEKGIKIVEGGGELGQLLSPKVEEEAAEEPQRPSPSYKLPPTNLLRPYKKERKRIDPKELEAKAALLEEKLRDFGVSGKVVSIHYGPVVSMFEYKPAPGIKVSKILNLQDDIAVVMKAGSVRVVAPIPGKDTIGIELPNDERETVYFSEIVASDAFRDAKSLLTLILGKDIFGKPFVADLRKMPHLLVAGATGSGKSVGLNSMICSILFKATPEDVKFILVDPKMLEFSVYNGVPHLITPVIVDPKQAAQALTWAVGEMERRYRLLSDAGVRNLESYNAKSGERLPYIVIVVDELADLMMVAGKDVELQIARLAQKARAAGIHLILATQRPSVDVITGLIKANFPSRISFKVSSKVDSRTILDTVGAEKLLGNGDMLFMPPGRSELIRLHGAYISDGEIEAIAAFWKQQASPEYSDIFSKPEVNGVGDENGMLRNEEDELYDDAVEFVCNLGYASASLLQRHFKIGYNRAARLIEMMEKEGIVGPAQGSKPREVLKRKKPKVNFYDDEG